MIDGAKIDNRGRVEISFEDDTKITSQSVESYLLFALLEQMDNIRDILEQIRLNTEPPR